jgi:hypothetical protein
MKTRPERLLSEEMGKGDLLRLQRPGEKALGLPPFPLNHPMNEDLSAGAPGSGMDEAPKTG